MNKTINVNIGGLFFHMDETAYQYLKGYLDAVAHSLRENKESQKEILDDIESRISELLTERITDKRQVVNKNDIDEIIKIMGKPEDYLVDEELFTSEEVPPRKTNFKKLFRDLDNKYLGGVCSGLANYISIDVIWVRLIFILLLFSGFSSHFGYHFNDHTTLKIGIVFPLIFVYILLWILIPPAKTTTEKLQMTGKPVTITNIEEKRKEETYYKSSSNLSENEVNVEQNITSPPPTRPKKSFLRSLANGIVAIFAFFFKLIGKLIGIALILGTSIAFIAICIGLFSWGSFEILGVFDEFVKILTTIFILISVPLFGLLLLGIKIISHKATLFNKPTWMTLLALWLISLFIIIFFGIDVTSQTKYSNKYAFKAKELPYLPQDTIFVKMDNPRTTRLPINVFLTNVLHSSNNKALLKISKNAKGRSFDDAMETAQKINFNYNVSQNVLLLDKYAKIDKKYRFKASFIHLELVVPENIVINFDNSVRFNHLLKSEYNIQCDKNHYYKVTKDGLQPTEATKKWEEEQKEKKK